MPSSMMANGMIQYAAMKPKSFLVFAFCVALASLSVSAVADEWRFEVAADAPRVVSCRVDEKFAERMATHDLVAVGDDGRETPFEWVIDESGETPELVWMADVDRIVKVHPQCGRI